MDMEKYLAMFHRQERDWIQKIKSNTPDVKMQPPVGPDAGRLIAFLIQLTGAKKALELGTSIGEGSVILGKALEKNGGSLVTVEKEIELCKIARENIKQAGFNDVVHVLCDDVQNAVKNLVGPFDLVFQDSDKFLYEDLLEDTIRLTRSGGLIIADDALFVPLGISPKYEQAIHEYNLRVYDDPRLTSVLVPVGDGLLISMKK